MMHYSDPSLKDVICFGLAGSAVQQQDRTLRHIGIRVQPEAISYRLPVSRTASRIGALILRSQ